MLNWQIGFVVAGVLGFVDGRLGFAALLLIGLLGLIA